MTSSMDSQPTEHNDQPYQAEAAQDFKNQYTSNVREGIRQSGEPTRGPNSIFFRGTHG